MCSYGSKYFPWKGSPILLFLHAQQAVHLARWRKLRAPHAAEQPWTSSLHVLMTEMELP